MFSGVWHTWGQTDPGAASPRGRWESFLTSCSALRRNQTDWRARQSNPAKYWRHVRSYHQSRRREESSYLKTQGVHLQQHLESEENDEEHVGDLLELLQPVRLVVVLGGEDPGVEKHQDDDEPEHRLGLHGTPAVSSRFSVPSENQQVFKHHGSYKVKYKF